MTFVRFALLAALSLEVSSAQPFARYSTDAEFLRGSITNLNQSLSGALQINPPTGTTTFPFLNAAASARGTVVRVQTNAGQVVGEFRTAPEGLPTNPSRTTVDLEGNVWTGNRDEGRGNIGSATKIGLLVGGTRVLADGTADINGEYLRPPFAYNTCRDRNNDGLIRTSRGLGNILPWPNAGDGTRGNDGLVRDAVDECILIYQRAGGPNTRHLSVDRNNDVWVGGYPFSPTIFNKLKGSTGEVLDTVDVRAFGCGGYGGLIDRQGILWSAGPTEGRLLRYDPVTRVGVCTNAPGTYGLGIDPVGGVWGASYNTNRVYKFNADGSVAVGFPKPISANGPTGTAVSSRDGNVWMANRFSANVQRLSVNGEVRKVIAVGFQPTGVAVDSVGKIWVTNLDSHNIMRIDPSGGNDQLGAVDLTINLQVPGLPNAGPYNYSDMTGSVAIGSTSPQGTWTLLQDSMIPGNAWSLIQWNTEAGARLPAGAEIRVEARAADTPANLGTFIAVQNGARFIRPGRYIEVKVTLLANDLGESPILTDVGIYSQSKIEDLLSQGKDGAVDIRWTAIRQASSYNVYRRAEAGTFQRIRSGLPASATLFSDTTVVNGTKYLYSVRWLDAAGQESVHSIEPSSTPVSRTARGQVWPTILSVPVTKATQDQAYSYPVRASDPDAGDRLTYELAVAPQGMTINGGTGLISWRPSPTQTGEVPVRVAVKDIAGHATTQGFSIFVTAVRVNAAPVITSTPRLGITARSPYKYDVDATDANAGDVLAYSLEQAAAGAAISPLTGLIEWTPTQAQIGSHAFIARVTDPEGATAAQAFTVVVSANRSPVITSTPILTGGTGTRYQHDVNATDPDSDLLVYEVQGPTGMFMSPATGLIEWTPQITQIGTHAVTATVRDSGGLTAVQTWNVAVALRDRAPVFTSTAPGQGSIGVLYTYTAAATDPENAGVRYQLVNYPYNATINQSTGELRWVPNLDHAGANAFVVRATDGAGLRVEQSFTVNVGAADTILPTLSLVSPAPGTAITGDVPIVGTATDPNLRLWRVEYQVAGSNRWNTLLSGTTPVNNGRFGVIPATFLANDAYRLRLYAEDTSGSITTPDIGVTINTEKLKFGAFTLNYDDVSVEGFAFPVVVRRSYDSRRVDAGDFGPGWSLGFNGLALRLDDSGNAFVTLPDGKRAAFAFTPVSSGFVGFFNRYTAAAGVTDKLETIDCTLVFRSGNQNFCAFEPDYNPQQWKLTTKSGVIYEFDRAGRITKITDRNGRLLSVTNNGVQTNFNRTVTFTRNAAGRITQISDPAGNINRYEYDPSGRLIRHTNPVNEVTTFVYTGSTQFIAEIRTSGGCLPLQVQYGPDGRVSGRTDARGNLTRIVYDIPNRREVRFDPLNAATRYQYDARGNLTSITDPQMNVTSYIYDANDNATATVYPGGKRVDRTFDAQGNILTQTLTVNGIARTTTFAWSALNQLLEVRRPLGDRTTYEYDARGNLTKRQRRNAASALIHEEAYTYDAQGRTETYIDGVGKVTSYVFNGNDELIVVRDATNRTTTYTYDQNGNVASITDGSGNRTVLEYNGLNLVSKITDGTKILGLGAYNGIGQLTSWTDALGRTKNFGVSCSGLLERVVDAAGASTMYGYTPNDDLASYTDPLGRTTTISYDPVRRPTQRLGPDNQRVQWSYTPDGQISVETNQASQTRTYEYDGSFEQIKEVRPEKTIDYSYDANGRLTLASETAGASTRTTTLTYDGIGRLATVVAPGSRTTTYGWNGRDQKTMLTSPDGLVTNYTYDDAGRLATVATGPASIIYTYDAARRKATATASNGVVTSYTYDNRGRVLSIVIRNASSTVLSSFTYVRDAAGKIISVTSHNGASAYTYDSVDRLTKEVFTSSTLASGTQSWSYDAAGNRLDPGAQFGVDHRLNAITGTAFTYDAKGNMLTKGSNTFTYDSTNHIVTGTGVSAVSYEYDVAGRRRTKVSGATTREFLYDGANVLVEYRGGAVAARYTYGSGVDEILMVHAGGVPYFYHTDANGNVVLITDAAGAVAHRYTYDAWGKLRATTGSFSFSGSGLVNTLTFQAREYDVETATYHFRARDYDPQVGRFLQKDPLQGEMRNPQTLHPYAFALNDPVNHRDPSGETALFSYSFSVLDSDGVDLIGFLNGYGVTNLIFVGEFLGVQDLNLDIQQQWDEAITLTEIQLRPLRSMYDILEIVGGLPGDFAEGAKRGSTEALKYLRGLRPN